MIVLEVLESILTYQTFITRCFLLMFVFGILFMLIRGGNKK